MSSQELISTSSPRCDSHDTDQVSAETLDRCAQLLANGEMDWPQGFSGEQEAKLLRAVRRFRRARLVTFIASHIAADIASERRGEE